MLTSAMPPKKLLKFIHNFCIYYHTKFENPKCKNDWVMPILAKCGQTDISRAPMELKMFGITLKCDLNEQIGFYLI